MPYTQSWIDPHTGATYPQSYVRSSPPQVDFGNQRVGFVVGRYASLTCYSLGYSPLEARDVQVAGVAYGSWFGTQVSSMQASLMAGLSVAADTYIGSVPTLSGAQPSL